MQTSGTQQGKPAPKHKTVAKAVMTPTENKKRTEVKIEVKEKVVVFFIGGAADKDQYYFNGPNHNIREAQEVFDPKVKDLALRKLYESVYLSYADVKGDGDITSNVIAKIPSKKTPVYIVATALAGGTAHTCPGFSQTGVMTWRC